jgi:hypothetical protein
VETPQEPIDDKQRYMRQLEGLWDVHKFDLYYRRERKEQRAEEVLEGEEGGLMVEARNTKKTKRGTRSNEGSRLRNVLVSVLGVVGRSVWRIRKLLLLAAIVGFGAAEVFSALVGANPLIILFGVLAALSGIVLFIFA